MAIDEKLINEWSADRWLEKKRKLSDCVWCEGALLAHKEEDKIYLAPEPTDVGVIFEIRVADIVEVVETSKTKEKLDTSYIISRVYLNKKAVLLRLEWMLATSLPVDMNDLSEAASNVSTQTSSASLVDLSSVPLVLPADVLSSNRFYQDRIFRDPRQVFGEIDPKPEPKPTPTPKPERQPRQPRTPSGVSGVRG